MVIPNGIISVTVVRNDCLEEVTSPTPSFTTTAQKSADGFIIGWILSIESILIILTNLLVAIALVLLIRKGGNRSWSFVLNLAIADILVGLAITAIASDGIKAHMVSMLKEVCLLRMSFIITPSAASILTMFVISLDRYVAIKVPLRYSQLVGTKMIAGVLVCLWLLSTVVGFLPNVVTNMQHSRYESVCTFFSVINPRSIIIVFCAAFFPILLVFIYFYLDILKIAWSHQRRIEQTMQVSSRCVLPSRYWGHVKAFRTVTVLVGCFTLCWCPFFVVSVIQVLCPPCKLYWFLENHLWLLGLANSLINPLVYAFWQREVRQQLCHMFACMKVSQYCIKGNTDQTMITQTRNSLDPAISGQFLIRKPATIALAVSTCPNSVKQTTAVFQPGAHGKWLSVLTSTTGKELYPVMDVES